MNIRPRIGQFFLNSNKVYKVVAVSQGTDEIILRDTATSFEYRTQYSTFEYAYKQVWKVTAAAKMIGRTARAFYYYEKNGVINKPFCYPNMAGREVRYYTRSDILECRDLIASIAQGRPTYKRKINNTIIDPINLRQLMRDRFGIERKINE